MRSSTNDEFLKEFVEHFSEIRAAKDEADQELTKIQNEVAEKMYDNIIKKVFQKNEFHTRTVMLNGSVTIDHCATKHTEYVKDYAQKHLKKDLKQ